LTKRKKQLYVNIIKNITKQKDDNENQVGTAPKKKKKKQVGAFHRTKMQR
jgi:hypothetical protein